MLFPEIVEEVMMRVLALSIPPPLPLLPPLAPLPP